MMVMGTVVAIILLVLVVGLAIFAVARSVRIVPQARAGIVERFGRYHRTLHAGLNVVVPFIDRLRPLIDLREQLVTFPPQPVITMDNLVVGIDTVIYFQVTDPRAATYEIANYVAAVEQLTVTTLRNVVGGMDLDMTLTSRDKINGELRKELDEATGRWGLRVSRVELKAIEPPASIQDSMEKQMRADRDKRAAILSAEGAKQSAILTAEGARQAAVLRARGEAEATVVRADAEATAQATRARGEAQAIATVFQAIHEGNPDQRLLAYKYLEMLPEIAQGGANKLWIVPSELGKALEGIGGFFGNAGSGAADAGRHRQIQDPPDELPGQDGSGSITRLPLLPALAPGMARTWTWPESLTRASNAGCLAVAGPCRTAPSLSRKVDPCHGQVTQASPPVPEIRPWCSGPPRCVQWSASTWTASPRRTASTPR
jgi:regulator of protease activity HflC (stomatin/prohibitin superfamily)